MKVNLSENEEMGIHMKTLGGILSSQSWRQDRWWGRNTVVGPNTVHIWQPWSWRWGSSVKDEINRPGSKISGFYLKLFARWIRLAVCRDPVFFSSLKWAKSFPGLCSVLQKSRDVHQIKNTAAELPPAVRDVMIASWLSTYFKLLYSVPNVPEPFTFKCFTPLVKENRSNKLGLHLHSSQSKPEALTKGIAKDTWGERAEERGTHHRELDKQILNERQLAGGLRFKQWRRTISIARSPRFWAGSPALKDP